MAVQPISAALEGVGSSTRFGGEALDENGFVLTGQPIRWRSLNPAVATADSASGVVTAVASGQAAIEARSASLTGYALVTVSVSAAPALAGLDSAATGTSQQLSAMWGTSPADVWTVGTFGTVLHNDGTGWARPAASVTTSQHLWGVWGSSSGDVFAVGDGGTVYHSDGRSLWELLNARTSATLRGVWGSSPRDVFVVGAGGTIRHFDGAHWDSTSAGTAANLRAVWGTSAANVYAVGDGGTVLHFDGTNWSAEPSGTAAILFALWGTSAANVVAVGAGGTILRRGSSGWTVQPSGVSEALYGVWGTSAANMYAVGGSGTILRFSGTEWSPVSSGVSRDLFAIWGASTGEVHVGGAGGLALASARGGGPRLVFASMPATVITAGQTFHVEVRVVDGSGNLVTSGNDTVRLALGTNPAGATLYVGAGTGVSQGGVAAFDLRITRAATGYVLTASATGHQSARSPSFTVGPAAARTLAFVVQPSTTRRDSIIRPAPQVVVADSFYNVVSSETRDVSVFLGPNQSGGFLEGQTVRNASAGVVTYADLSVNRGGNDYTLVAAATGLASARSDTFRVLSSGVAASVTVVPDGLTAAVGDTVTMQAAVRDGDGTLLPNPTVVWTSYNSVVADSVAPGRFAIRGTGQAVMEAQVQGVKGNGVLTAVAPGLPPVAVWSVNPFSLGTDTLYGVSALGSGDLVAVGSRGAIVNCVSSTCQRAQSGTDETLRGLWNLKPVVGQRLTYAVTSSGALLLRGGPFLLEVARAPAGLFGVWGSSPTNVIVVSNLVLEQPASLSLNALFVYDGRAFQERAISGARRSFGIWGVAAASMFVAREHGGTDATSGDVRYCGSSDADLLAVWGTSASDVFFVGERGTIIHYNGSSCSQMVSPTTNTLRGVAGFAPNDVYAVGDAGTVLHYNGSGWTQLATPTTKTLRAVAVFSTGSSLVLVYAVGDDGINLVGQP